MNHYMLKRIAVFVALLLALGSYAAVLWWKPEAMLWVIFGAWVAFFTYLAWMLAGKLTR